MDGQARIVELEAKLARLEVLVAELGGKVAERDARIAELEKLLDESRRSGKRQAAPFSKGDPVEEPTRPGRKRGTLHGRHNHRGVPAGEPDRVLDALVAGCCPDCGGDVEVERIEDQWQVDLPEMRPTVTRFRVQVGRCGGCGRRVQGRHPEQTSEALGAARSQVGPVAKAWAVWLHYGLGLSFGKCSKLLGRLGVDVTAGALCSAAQATSTDLVPVQAGIVKHVNDAAMVVMDETGWRVGGLSAWLWVATTTDATAYNVADGRGFAEACRLVADDYSGVIVRDGWAPYRCYTRAAHQTCVAHLVRRCDELIADLPAWARHTPRQVNDILAAALAARDLDDDGRREVIADLAERIELLAEQAHPHDECRKLVKHLAAEAAALFSFLARPGVDATNWRAEQAIRPAVVNRKVWGGNRTWRGATTQSRMMSVLRTAAQQGTDAIEYLARLARAPTPADFPALFI
ncbi:MAG: IS66 family transposase [Acidimicrobiales bacterium]